MDNIDPEFAMFIRKFEAYTLSYSPITKRSVVHLPDNFYIWADTREVLTQEELRTLK